MTSLAALEISESVVERPKLKRMSVSDWAGSVRGRRRGGQHSISLEKTNRV